jgi:predicted TIM-barrel fold metal-dependent hydrolase
MLPSWNYWNGWNHWNRLLSGVFKAMEGLDPQVKRKILSDNARRLSGI